MPSTTFNGQSGWQTWDVPDGVDRVTVDLRGAGSSVSRGGRVSGVLKLRKGDRLYLLVGTQGKTSSNRQGASGGFGGGGAGGDADSGHNGGDGGGGAAAIRLNSTDGTIKVVAGGAGGRSGDNGNGGLGGGPIGLHGSLGTTSGGGQVGNASGGTQIQGGAGGSTAAGHSLDGHDGQDQRLGTGGRGGQNTNLSSHGGGGGGGGYYPGGGGAGARIGQAAGGGGGGGSSFTGGLLTVTLNEQGGGNLNDAQITLTWVSPPPANQPPGAPSDVKVNGVAESAQMSTRSTGTVHLSGIVRDPNQHTVAPTHTGGAATQAHQQARLLVRYSSHQSFTNWAQVHSDYVDYGKRAEVRITGLTQQTLYYCRVYAQDTSGALSTVYNSVTFWTNRRPDPPKLQAPSDNGVILDTDATSFTWSAQDPDSNDRQGGFTLRWRRAANNGRAAGKWQEITRSTSFSTYVTDPLSFKSNVYYDWTVRTRDQQGVWGTYATPRSFFVTGASAPPRLTSPINGQSVDVSGTTTLTWKFLHPTPGTSQVKADYRYRAVGSTDWATVLGDTTTPGAVGSWTVAADTFIPGVHYEWSARTYSDSAPTIPSDWSDPEDFHTHGAIGQTNLPVDFAEEFAVLGCGHNRAYIYDRGGQVFRGEITGMLNLSWSRTRDEMAEASVTTNGFGTDCGALLATVHTWMHELVIFRDGVRVFEGPITLIEDATTGFTITAKDVMGYVYRRALKQGFNDSYHLTQGLEEGVISVVERAGLIIADALARNDPNVLPYLTLLTYPNDAREARSVADYSMSAYDEIDDMAANAGLDYCVIGRRIILNDTHRPVGRLPEWRSDYFTDPPKITEYGMLLADEYIVTNGSGLWGSAKHPESPYGGVELVVNSFSAVGGENGDVLSAAKQEAVRRTLTDQAHRGIASRYPAPYIVRVPDNSRLVPDVPVGINQLVPGVWIPLRAQGTVVEISQWQKLDSVTVSEVAGDEAVSVTMSPAPNSGQDPDAEGLDAADGAVA